MSRAALPGTVLVLVVALGLGVFYTVYDVVSDFGGDPDWPGNASQIIATLLLALVLEDRILDRSTVQKSRLFKAMAIVLLLCAWQALFFCADSGGEGEGLEPFKAAFVDGVILGLAGVVAGAAIAAFLLGKPDDD